MPHKMSRVIEAPPAHRPKEWNERHDLRDASHLCSNSPTGAALSAAAINFIPQLISIAPQGMQQLGTNLLWKQVQKFANQFNLTVRSATVTHGTRHCRERALRASS